MSTGIRIATAFGLTGFAAAAVVLLAVGPLDIGFDGWTVSAGALWLIGVTWWAIEGTKKFLAGAITGLVVPLLMSRVVEGPPKDDRIEEPAPTSVQTEAESSGQ